MAEAGANTSLSESDGREDEIEVSEKKTSGTPAEHRPKK